MSRALHAVLAVAAAVALMGTNAAVDAAPAMKKDTAVDCSKPLVCPKVFVPLCDQDGNQYSNLCLMRGAECEDGKERIETPCPKKHRKQRVPESAFVSEEGEEEQPKLAPQARGLASRSEKFIVPDVCPQKCYKIYAPVCACVVGGGNNSDVHGECFKFSNQCMLESYACTDKSMEWEIRDCATMPAGSFRTEEEVKNVLGLETSLGA